METKLILFDIDGTLIRHVTSIFTSGWPRFIYAAKKAYGVDIIFDPKANYNGAVDRQILFNMVSGLGVTKEEFNAKFPLAAQALHEHATSQSADGTKYYQAIPEAVELAQKLSKIPDYHLGILTGNVKLMAKWKLAHTQINPDIFKILLTGDEFEDRLLLARSVFDEADAVFKYKFKPNEVVIIGDAIGDIKCAREIGASVIITMTGGHSTRQELMAEKPDLLVDNLADPRVYDFFKIK